jgi:hypothetical protein
MDQVNNNSISKVSTAKPAESTGSLGKLAAAGLQALLGISKSYAPIQDQTFQLAHASDAAANLNLA